MSYRLLRRAERDIEDILDYTFVNFGPDQVDRYAALIIAACRIIGETPMVTGSRPRNDLGANVRSYAVALAAGRTGGASHILYYVAERGADGRIPIIRVMHERMDPSRRISRLR
ncbi:MAG TPA: type II toxin-antitoxin system RelE/ParE family toxin [Azospirillaceae bacterium]|nr:type II toxin-antitoxin system RelE/ParE family toxin [Azospirillaceae bacterium]